MSFGVIKKRWRQQYAKICLYILLMEAINENKFSFWALPESPNPPHDPYSGNLVLFFLGVGSGVGREIF